MESIDNLHRKLQSGTKTISMVTRSQSTKPTHRTEQDEAVQSDNQDQRVHVNALCDEESVVLSDSVNKNVQSAEQHTSTDGGVSVTVTNSSDVTNSEQSAEQHTSQDGGVSVTVTSSDITNSEPLEAVVFVVDEYYDSLPVEVDIASNSAEKAKEASKMNDELICKQCQQKISSLQAVHHLTETHAIYPFIELSKFNSSGVEGAPNKRKIVQCEYCEKPLLTSHLKHHMDAVHPDRSHITCPMEGCDAKLISQEEANDHYRTVHEKSSPVCSRCNTKLLNFEAVQRHMENCSGHQWAEQTSENSYKILSSKANVSSHQTPTATKSRHIFCDQCRTRFRSTAALVVHQQNPANCALPKPTHCDQCSYVGNTTFRLQMHKKQVHSSDRPFSCPYDDCTSTFKIKYNLSLHIHKSHTGQKNVKCQTCGKMFFYHAQLRAHMETHGTEKKYTCDICKKQFVTKPQLSVHKKGVHSNTLFTCSECQFTTCHRSSMKRHLVTVHDIKDMVYVTDASSTSVSQELDAVETIQVQNADGSIQTVEVAKGELVIASDPDSTSLDVVITEDQEAMIQAVAMLQGDS